MVDFPTDLRSLGFLKTVFTSKGRSEEDLNTMSFSVSFSKGQLSAAGPHLLWLFLVAFMPLTRINFRWALAFQIPSLNNRAMSFCSFCATSPCLDLFYAPFLYLRLIRIFLFIHSGLLSPFMSSFISEWALLEIGGGDPGKSVRSTSTVE